MIVLGTAQRRIEEEVRRHTVPILRALPTSRRPCRTARDVAEATLEAANVLGGCLPLRRGYVLIVRRKLLTTHLVDEPRAREVEAAARQKTGDPRPVSMNCAECGNDPDQVARAVEGWANRLASCIRSDRGFVVVIRPGYAHGWGLDKVDAAMLSTAMEAACGDLGG